MDDREVGRYWERNAEAWTTLARQGYDICRDLYNTPTFLAMLPAVAGLRGLDIGCGEGHNTRQVAGRGAAMSALDLAPTFTRHAREAELAERRGIRYLRASGQALPFPDAAFDFAMATMSFMDMPRPERAVAEAARVIKPGGFFQFSISHPCFNPPLRFWVHDDAGERHALAVGDYFRHTDGDVERWIFGAAPPEARAPFEPFQVPRFHRPLAWWLNTLTRAGFALEEAAEPTPSDEALAQWPRERDARIAPLFLILRGRRGSRPGD